MTAVLSSRCSADFPSTVILEKSRSRPRAKANLVRWLAGAALIAICPVIGFFSAVAALHFYFSLQRPDPVRAAITEQAQVAAPDWVKPAAPRSLATHWVLEAQTFRQPLRSEIVGALQAAANPLTAPRSAVPPAAKRPATDDLPSRQWQALLGVLGTMGAIGAVAVAVANNWFAILP